MKKITLLFIAALLGNAAFSQTAKIQAVHNSPDAALSVIDVYLGPIRIIDNMPFQSATPFLDAPSDVPITFTIAPANSTSVEDGVYSYTDSYNDGMKYIITLDGIHSETGYAPAPELKLDKYFGAFDGAFMEGNAGILIHQGCTDSGNINVSETSVPLGMFIYDMPYQVYTAGYMAMPIGNYEIAVTTTADNTLLGSYQVPLATMNMNNKAAMILASGFVHPENNSNGAPYGLFMVMPEGGWFIPLQSTMATEDFNVTTVKAYPNPASDILNLNIPSGYDSVEAKIYDMSGREVASLHNTEKFDVSGITNGVYILNALIDGKRFTQKVTVAH